jgi:hippurate hydrolase
MVKVAELEASVEEMIGLRHQIHANPELGYQEFMTGDLVAERLAAWGYAVDRGLAGTGVVGTLRLGDGSRRLGLRADMDALPIHETTGLPYASKVAGKMHACGHDGHTAMLLAAARHLAQTRNFNGTLNLIFQPAEEGLAGARRMLSEGVLEKFPCDAVFALHNMPGYPAGKLGFMAGPFMASADRVTVKVIGKGGHGAVPHKTIDPVVVCSAIVMALQTIVSRNIAPLDTAIITVGSIHAGQASNIIADFADMLITVRALREEVRAVLEKRIIEVIHAQAAVYGATAEVIYHSSYPVLINDAEQTAFARRVGVELVGEANILSNFQPFTGSEDFAYFLQACPGCYFIIGNGDGDGSGEGGCMIHNPGYDFNDGIMPIGASYWALLAQRFLV